MRPLAVAVPVAVLALGGVAAASGAFSSGSTTTPMKMSRAAVAAKPVLELHRASIAIAIRDFAFVPAHVVVSPGTRITWTNDDQDPHT
jgi:plastocyanin